MRKENLIKFINSDSSLKEQEDVFRWLDVSVDNRKYFENLKAIWTLSALPDERATKADYLKFKSKYQIKKEKSFRKGYYISAMMVAASLVLFFFLTPYFKGEESFINENTIHLANNGNEIAYYTLPDGSRITLFPGSTLYYNPGFATEREVLLKGKGYFEVKANLQYPFRVYTPSAEVKVTGTKFMVNIPERDTKDLLNVFLEEGVVCVKSKKGGKEIVLDPGDLITVHEDFSFERIGNSQMNPDMEILSKNLYFENERMELILEKLERYHNVSFVCCSEKIKEMLFTGDLKGETLDSLLELFYQTMGVQYAVKERVVELH